MIVAATAIEVASATEDGAICQVEPQVLSHVTLGALPATNPKRKEIELKYGSGVSGSGREKGDSVGPCQSNLSLFSSPLDVPLLSSLLPRLPNCHVASPLSHQISQEGGLFAPALTKAPGW